MADKPVPTGFGAFCSSQLNARDAASPVLTAPHCKFFLERMEWLHARA